MFALQTATAERTLLWLDSRVRQRDGGGKVTVTFGCGRGRKAKLTHSWAGGRSMMLNAGSDDAKSKPSSIFFFCMSTVYAVTSLLVQTLHSLWQY